MYLQVLFGFCLLIFTRIISYANEKVISSAFYEEEFEDEFNIIQSKDILEPLSINRLDISPHTLIFNDSYLCIPTIATFQITNLFQDIVNINSISSSDFQFYPILFEPKQLSFQETITIQIVYLPYKLDLNHAHLDIQTSQGPYSYSIQGFADVNPYRINPFLTNKATVGSVIPDQSIAIHNPYPQPLHILEVYTTDDFLSLKGVSLTQVKNSTSDKDNKFEKNLLWSIPSGKERNIISFSINSNLSPGMYKGFIHIKTDLNKVIIPVEVEILLGSISPVPSVIDFGFVKATDQPRSLPLALFSPSLLNFVIFDIVVDPPDYRIYLQHQDLPFVTSQSDNIIVDVFLDPSIKGNIDCMILITTNNSLISNAIIEVPIKAILYEGHIGYDPSSFIFQFPFNRYDTVKDIHLQNLYNIPVNIHSISTSGLCTDILDISFPKKSSNVSSFHYWPLFHIAIDQSYFNHEEYVMPRTCWLEIHSIIGIEKIPVFFIEGRIELEMVDSDVLLNEKTFNFHVSKFVDSFHLNLGSFSSSNPRPVKLLLSNPNPVSLYFNYLENNFDFCLCLEAMWPLGKPSIISQKNVQDIIPLDYSRAIYDDRCFCRDRLQEINQIGFKPGFYTLVSIAFNQFSTSRGVCELIEYNNNYSVIQTHSNKLADSQHSFDLKFSSRYQDINIHMDSTELHLSSDLKTSLDKQIILGFETSFSFKSKIFGPSNSLEVYLHPTTKYATITPINCIQNECLWDFQFRFNDLREVNLSIWNYVSQIIKIYPIVENHLLEEFFSDRINLVHNKEILLHEKLYANNMKYLKQLSKGFSLKPFEVGLRTDGYFKFHKIPDIKLQLPYVNLPISYTSDISIISKHNVFFYFHLVNPFDRDIEFSFEFSNPKHSFLYFENQTFSNQSILHEDTISFNYKYFSNEKLDILESKNLKSTPDWISPLLKEAVFRQYSHYESNFSSLIVKKLPLFSISRGETKLIGPFMIPTPSTEITRDFLVFKLFNSFTGYTPVKITLQRSNIDLNLISANIKTSHQLLMLHPVVNSKKSKHIVVNLNNIFQKNDTLELFFQNKGGLSVISELSVNGQFCSSNSQSSLNHILNFNQLCSNVPRRVKPDEMIALSLNVTSICESLINSFVVNLFNEKKSNESLLTLEFVYSFNNDLKIKCINDIDINNKNSMSIFGLFRLIIISSILCLSLSVIIQTYPICLRYINGYFSSKSVQKRNHLVSFLKENPLQKTDPDPLTQNTGVEFEGKKIKYMDLDDVFSESYPNLLHQCNSSEASDFEEETSKALSVENDESASEEDDINTLENPPINDDIQFNSNISRTSSNDFNDILEGIDKRENEEFNLPNDIFSNDFNNNYKNDTNTNKMEFSGLGFVPSFDINNISITEDFRLNNNWNANHQLFQNNPFEIPVLSNKLFDENLLEEFEIINSDINKLISVDGNEEAFEQSTSIFTFEEKGWRDINIIDPSRTDEKNFFGEGSFFDELQHFQEEEELEK